jgi:hypothetical protein
MNPRPKLPLIQRIREEHLDRAGFVGAVAASVGVEIAAHFERIELRVVQRDRTAVHAALGHHSKQLCGDIGLSYKRQRPQCL